MPKDPLSLLCVEPRFPCRIGFVADWLVRRRGYSASFPRPCRTGAVSRDLCDERVHRPGRNRFLEPLFDTERFVETTLRVLDDPATFRPLGNAMRATILQRHHFDGVIPRLEAFLSRVARDCTPSRSAIP
jgi:hypothetical protein